MSEVSFTERLSLFDKLRGKTPQPITIEANAVAEITSELDRVTITVETEDGLKSHRVAGSPATVIGAIEEATAEVYTVKPRPPQPTA